MILTKRRDITPLIMWLTLFAGIIIFTFIRINNRPAFLDQYPAYWDILCVSLYLVWMIVELRVTKKDVNTEGKKTYDYMTCQVYGAGQALTILTALWFPSIWRVPNTIHFVGISSFILGACYRLWAIYTLGRFYSHRVRTVSHHHIVVSGPYRVTRHPAYAGMIIANTGITVFFLNWVTLCVFLFILVPAIILRILIEEKMLFMIEGYAEFAKKRKRLFPAVW